MTNDLTKELAELVSYITEYPDTALNGVLIAQKCSSLVRTHHATIQQNAEAALWLRALEQALDEYMSAEDGWANVYAAHIRHRADAILREWAEGSK